MLPSQDLYYSLVLDCLYVECRLLGSSRPNCTKGLKKEAITDRLRAALLLKPSDTHDNKPTRKVYDAERVDNAVRALLKVEFVEHDTKTTYRITKAGIKAITSKMSLSGIAEICSYGKRPRMTEKLLSGNKHRDLPDDEEDVKIYAEADTMLYLLCDRTPRGNRKFEVAACLAINAMTGLDCKVTSYVADEGIDGECFDNNGKLVGLIQAKRFTGVKRVNNAPVSQLLGDCLRFGVDTGYFVTTSTFAPSAIRVLEAECPIKIVPVDGHLVAELLAGNAVLYENEPEENVAVDAAKTKIAKANEPLPKPDEPERDFPCHKFAKYLDKVGKDSYKHSGSYYKWLYKKNPNPTNNLKDQTVTWFWNYNSFTNSIMAKSKTVRTSKVCYQRLGNPAMLLWIAEAVGVNERVVANAMKAAKAAKSTATACAIIRSFIPWETVAGLVTID